MSDVPKRLDLGLRAKDAPGKTPGSGCGCGRHGKNSEQKRGCGCGGHGRRHTQLAQPPIDSLRAIAVAEAAELVAKLGVELPDNPAAATDLEA